MSRPRFLFDEDFRRDIARAVQRMEAAVEWSTVQELGLTSRPDPEVLEYAWKHRWQLVSHDVNTMSAFAQDRIQNGLGLSGLFLSPQVRPLRPIVESLVLIWAVSEAEEWHDRIVCLPI